MKHNIIVKWNDSVADKKAILSPVRALFADARKIEGIHAAEIIENCIDRPNRYDCMITVHMEKTALPAWDTSDIHKQWKSEYGDYIAQKAIFDCE